MRRKTVIESTLSEFFMAILMCKSCGGKVELNEEQTVAECPYCFNMTTFPKISDERLINLFNRANYYRQQNEFDKALSVYENILGEDERNAEAHWCAVLCRYGIEYVEDPRSHERIPTCHRASRISLFDDIDYKAALEYSDPVAIDLYIAEAKRIDEINKIILQISFQEEPYDIFICYKETSDILQRTKDSVIAQDVYEALSNVGLKVFFARITLEDKLGKAYEPYIFAALNSARVMLAFGSRREYYDAVWVKNEWSRFISLMKSDKQKTLIPCYFDMNPYELPDEFSYLQAQDMGKVGAQQDLIRGVKKLFPEKFEQREKAQPVQSAHEVQQNPAAPSGQNFDTLLEIAYTDYATGNLEKAKEGFQSVFRQDIKNIGGLYGIMVTLDNADEIRIYYDKVKAMFPKLDEKEKPYINSRTADRLFKRFFLFSDYERLTFIVENYLKNLGTASNNIWFGANGGDQHKALTLLALKNGLNPNITYAMDGGRVKSLLAHATTVKCSDNLDFVRRVIECGADVDALVIKHTVEDNGKAAMLTMNALYYAIIFDASTDVIKAILDGCKNKGACLNFTLKENNSTTLNVLYEALKRRRMDLADLFYTAGAKLSDLLLGEKILYGLYRFDVAYAVLFSGLCTTNTLRWIYKHGGFSKSTLYSEEINKKTFASTGAYNYKYTLLDRAITARVTIPVLDVLLENGENVNAEYIEKANVNTSDTEKDIQSIHHPILAAALTRSAEEDDYYVLQVVEWLLAHGANSNAVSYWVKDGYRCERPMLVYSAMLHPSAARTEILLKSGANPNVEYKRKGEKGENRYNMIDTVLGSKQPSPAILKLLYKYGAKPNSTITYEQYDFSMLFDYLFFCEKFNPEIVKVMLANGENPNEIIPQYTLRQRTINKMWYCHTPIFLLYLLEYDNLEVTKSFLEHGANVNTVYTDSYASGYPIILQPLEIQWIKTEHAYLMAEKNLDLSFKFKGSGSKLFPYTTLEKHLESVRPKYLAEIKKIINKRG